MQIKHIYGLFALILSLNSLLAQNTKENWKKYNDQSLHDTIRLQELNEIIREVRKSDLDSAIRLSRTYIAFAKKGGTKKFEAFGEEIIAGIFSQKGLIDSSLKYHFLSLEKRKILGRKKPIAKSLAYIGDCYYYKTDYVSSLEYLQQSLKISESIPDSNLIARTLNTMGAVYEHLPNKNKECVQCYKRVLKINERLKDTFSIAIALTNLGNQFLSVKQYDSAEIPIKKANLLFERIGNPNYIALNLLALSHCYQGQKRIDKHKETLLKLISLRSKLTDIYTLSNAENELAHLFYLTNEMDKAILHAHLALGTSFPLKSNQIRRDIYRNLTLIYKKMHKMDSAFHYMTEFSAMKDSIVNENIQEQITKKQVSFEFERKAYSDSLANVKQQAIAEAQMARQEEKIKSQSIIQLLMLGGLILLILFGVFIYNRYKVINAQKKVIELQKEIVEHKQKEVIDSINYAQRIQRAQMPSEKRFENLINKLKK